MPDPAPQPYGLTTARVVLHAPYQLSSGLGHDRLEIWAKRVLCTAPGYEQGLYRAGLAMDALSAP